MPQWYPGANAPNYKVEPAPVLLAQTPFFQRSFQSQALTVTQPATVAANVAVLNNTGYNCLVYSAATTGIGTVSIGAQKIAGTITSNTMVPAYVIAGQTITITYTGVLTWFWQAM